MDCILFEWAHTIDCGTNRTRGEYVGRRKKASPPSPQCQMTRSSILHFLLVISVVTVCTCANCPQRYRTLSSAVYMHVLWCTHSWVLLNLHFCSVCVVVYTFLGPTKPTMNSTNTNFCSVCNVVYTFLGSLLHCTHVCVVVYMFLENCLPFLILIGAGCQNLS